MGTCTAQRARRQCGKRLKDAEKLDTTENNLTVLETLRRGTSTRNNVLIFIYIFCQQIKLELKSKNKKLIVISIIISEYLVLSFDILKEKTKYIV